MNTKETVAFRIRQLCDEHGITPNKLATISGVFTLCDDLEIYYPVSSPSQNLTPSNRNPI